MQLEVPSSTLRSAASGERNAQEQVLLLVHDHVRRSLFRLLLGRTRELDDLTQLALMRVLTGLPSYRFEAELTTWVTGICANVVREHLRKQRREPPTELSIQINVAAGSSQSRLEARDSLGRCAEVIQGMSPHHRTAFLLRVVEGYSVDEVAAIMGSARSTARMRLFYARRAFRRALKQTRSVPVGFGCLAFPEEIGGES